MYRKFIIAFVAVLMVVAVVSAQTTIPGGYVSGTWTAAGSPYLIEGNITIHEDSSLTINPPVDVYFQDYYGLTVNGLLEALGNQVEWILFLPADTSIGWAGITLYEAVDTSQLSYCSIEYAMNASGIYCWDSNLSLYNCSISRNQASDGGGLFLVSSTVTATNCTIEENTASGFGGGVFSGFGGMLTLSNCYINFNECGSRGGGIYSSGPELNLDGCTIVNSTASEKGGGIYIDGSLCNLTECALEGNSGGVHAINNYGGGGLFASYADLMITDCGFFQNVSEGNGGGICLSGGEVNISNCTFAANANDGSGTQYDGGGGIFANDVNLTISDCTFDGNGTMLLSGGGMCILNSDGAVIEGCSVTDNTSNFMGGGLFCKESSGVILSNCDFRGNSANYSSGGGMNVLDAGELTISGCIFNGNSAFFGAGALDLGGVTNSILSNCTLCTNVCEDAGGISISSACTNITVINTIAALNVGPGIDNGSASTSITYSDFFDNLGGDVVDLIPPGLGELVQVNANDDSCDVYCNIFLEPLFVDLMNGDMHLQAGSPCIDAGDPTWPLDPDSTITDIGALFFDQALPEIAVSATSLEFGIVTVGEEADLPLTIYNVGNDTLELYDVFSSLEAFSNSWNPAQNLIPAEDSLEITVTFAPSDSGYYTDVLFIDNNDEMVSITLYGEGELLPALPETPTTIPDQFALYGPYPNPFNPTTTIRFDLPIARQVTLNVFDINGRRINVGTQHAAPETGADWYPPGTHNLTIDGSGLSSGIYIYRLSAGEFIASGKMVLMK
jgi:hypothetical protein